MVREKAVPRRLRCWLPGGLVSPGHRKSLLDFALGEAAVQARNDGESATGNAKKANQEITLYASQLSALHPGMTLPEFEQPPKVNPPTLKLPIFRLDSTPARTLQSLGRAPFRKRSHCQPSTLPRSSRASRQPSKTSTLTQKRSSAHISPSMFPLTPRTGSARERSSPAAVPAPTATRTSPRASSSAHTKPTSTQPTKTSSPESRRCARPARLPPRLP